jgi:hypothetical protein
MRALGVIQWRQWEIRQESLAIEKREKQHGARQRIGTQRLGKETAQPAKAAPPVVHMGDGPNVLFSPMVNQTCSILM